jgi:hypothetical protein
MQVYHRLVYEMNRQLLADCATALSDCVVMNALSSASGHRMQPDNLGTMIGWERSCPMVCCAWPGAAWSSA